MPRPTAPTDPSTDRGERIAKLLARAGVASRREVERMIAEGRVAIDGTAVATPATLLRSLAGVTVDGRPVAAPAPARLFLYHKPPGLLVTERDPAGRPTIYDRLPAGLPRVVPVGRLDLATEGLLLLTTDGGLKRTLELPATGVERTYRARAYGPVTQAQLEELIEGVEVDGVRYGSIDANLERRTGANVWIELTLTEGKNREVRRVLEHLELQVGRLIRTRYGPFVLADLQPGDVGEVAAGDLTGFRAQLGRRVEPDVAIAVAPLRPTQVVAGDRDRLPPASGGEAPLPMEAKSRQTSRAGAEKTGDRSNTDRPHPSGASRLPPSPTGRGKGPARRQPGGNGEGDGRTNTKAVRPPRSPSGTSHSSPDRRPSPRLSRATPRDQEDAERMTPRLRSARTDRESGTGRTDREGRAGKAVADVPSPTPPRPPRPVRKPGWARPKPRSGPGRPRK